MRFRRRSLLRSSLLQGAAVAVPLAGQSSSNYTSGLPPGVTRPWIAGEFWANPLQDWQLANGRIECIVSGGDRNVALLTRETGADFTLQVELGAIENNGTGFAGFRVGSQGYWKDYRDTALRGAGLDAGITTDGKLFIGTPAANAPTVPAPSAPMKLKLTAANGGVTLQAFDSAGKELAKVESKQQIKGAVGLVCHAGTITKTPPRRNIARQGSVRYWFRNLTLSGPTVTAHDDRAFGPLLFNQYTVTRRTLKMGVQCAPLEPGPHQAELQTQRGAAWRTIAKSSIDPIASVAQFRIDNWDDTKDTPYRVIFTHDGKRHTLAGTIAHNPQDKRRLVIGALTCQNDIGFPHAQIAGNLKHLQPDILFFTGDQIYERSADYGNQMEPPAAARLDYLRKWFLFGWSWGQFTRNIPCICLPDDHDVYHGNLWGCAGRKAEKGATTQAWQDSGGYKMPADWVNMVQRTQTCHMPDPPDPSPVDQGITVHYCHVQWGGMSFAVLEDRKWKSAPKEWMPKAQIVNGWPQNRQWNAATDGNITGPSLLGERQEKFLEDWARDWSNGTFIKAAVSATIFCNVATLPPPATTDSVTGSLPVQPIGGYPEGEMKTMDHDSNAWPQQPRNRALRSMRRALAFHIAGDQHLASTVQYGIDDWNDAAFAICTPAISNIFPRRWYPAAPGKNPLPSSPRNTGEFTDAFGNKLTVHSVANPAQFGKQPPELYNRAVGFGCIEIFRDTREIVFTNWPYWEDVSKPDAKPYPGWPIKIQQTGNGLPRSKWKLPQVPGGQVIEVIDEADNELVYTFRLPANSFTPTVPRPGSYTVRLYDPDTKKEEIRKAQLAR
jgi:phosphodiesterase/alkaline phosphatase D-like protein